MNTTLARSLGLLALSLSAVSANPTQAAVLRGTTSPLTGLQVVGGHVRPEMFRAPLVGEMPQQQTLHLAIGLPMRSRLEAQALVAAISDPASANYRRYLTPAQYEARFSPTTTDYQAIAAFARASHFTVTRAYPNRYVLDVDATVSQIEHAFHLTLQRRLRADGSVFYAPSNDPALALATPILHIAGLDSQHLPEAQIASEEPINSMLRARPGLHAEPDLGSGPGGTYAGSDFRNAYASGATQTGSAQCVGLFELDASFFPADIASYQAAFALPALVPQKVLLDGFNGLPVVSKGEEETALDIEVAQAMAPGVSNIFVYEGSNPDDVLAAMASPGPSFCNQLSASWTFPVDSTSQQIVDQMALQGQSFFAASGDAGGWTSDTNDDRDLSNTTIVGGTNLAMNGIWVNEVAWPHSGGGPENNEYTPPFQSGLQLDSGGGAGSGHAKSRIDPDVSMVASNTYLIANNGKGLSVSGTSISTPLWAGYTALINQEAQSVGVSPLGFADPPLYKIARSAAYSANFHDITSGNNGPWTTSPGYDLVTGWGSPQTQIISTLNPKPIANYTKLQITVYTGHDDLRPDSDLAASFTGISHLSPFCLMRSNNGSPSGICTGNVYGDVNGTQGWGSWSTQTLTYYNRFANWTWSGLGTMKLTMTSHNNFPETNDNWDLQAMQVTLSNPLTGASVSLFDVGNFSAPHNPGTCYWRFKPTGSPPVAIATFKLLPRISPGNGCPGD